LSAKHRWAIIYNPVAGGFRRGALERIGRALRDAGVAAEFVPTSRPGHGTELGRAIGGVACVAVYGGDGTLNEVANGLAGRDVPLAFLPGGTANVMARELGLPPDPARAARLLARGPVRAVRPGGIGGRLFLLMAGFGFDGDAAHRVSPALKARFGKGAYLWAGMRALFAPSPLMRVTPAEGEEREGVWVVAARARRYGGEFTIHPRAGLMREALGLTVVGRLGVLPFLAVNLGLGLPWPAPRTWFEEHRHLRVTSSTPVHVQLDGDYFGSGNAFEVELAEQTLPLCFPP
jgi:diacylglycerol kinase family enzyme